MSKLIFFVDDDKMIINLLEYTFQSRQQYNVLSFNSGEDCLASLDRNPDLIVLDYQLSPKDDTKLSGIDTLEIIKQNNINIPVIMLTAFGNDGLYKRSTEKGVDYFLTKDDYFIDSLVEMIDEVLN